MMVYMKRLLVFGKKSMKIKGKSPIYLKQKVPSKYINVYYPINRTLHALPMRSLTGN